jgi:hypothetical protein
MILTGARLRNLRAARWTPVLRNWVESAAAVIVKLKDLAPYALIELVLPGGSVMALLLWLYRRRKNGTNFGQLPVALPLGFMVVGFATHAKAKEAGAVGARGTRNGQ